MVGGSVDARILKVKNFRGWQIGRFSCTWARDPTQARQNMPVTFAGQLIRRAIRALAQALGVLPRWVTWVSAHVESALMTAMSL